MPDEITPDAVVDAEAPAGSPTDTETTESPKPAGLPDDIAVLRAEIEKLRKENGAERVNAKAQAADAAKSELAQQIGKALGLVKDDEPADPARLTEQLTAKDSEARQAKVELAVFRAAQATDADPNALLDSRAFLAKVAELDPSDTAAYAAAVADAVKGNPRLGKPEAQAAPRMKPNPVQGSSAGAELTLGQRITAATESGDHATARRLKASMALDPNHS